MRKAFPNQSLHTTLMYTGHPKDEKEDSEHMDIETFTAIKYQVYEVLKTYSI